MIWLVQLMHTKSKCKNLLLVVLLILTEGWKKQREGRSSSDGHEMSDQAWLARLKTQLSEFEKSHNNAMVELMAEHTNKEKARLREAKASQEELKATLTEEKNKELDEASAKFNEEMEEMKRTCFQSGKKPRKL